MSVWLILFLPILVTVILLAFFRKHVVVWEVLVLNIPSAILILLMNTIMIHSLTDDVEYLVKNNRQQLILFHQDVC